MLTSSCKLVTDRDKTAGFFPHVFSDVLGTLCDPGKHSRCEMVNIKLVLLGNLFKIIDRPESLMLLPTLFHSKLV